MQKYIAQSLVFNMIAMPFLVALGLAFLAILRPKVKASVVETAVAVLMILVSASALMLFVMVMSGYGVMEVTFGDWYHASEHHADLTFLIDHLSAAFGLLSAFLTAVVGFFSGRYLLKDPSFLKYFICYSAFTGSLSLIIFAGSTNLIFFGWEILGLTSVLLISYFMRRSGPLEGGMRALATYRFCDAFLLMAVLIWDTKLHHYAFPIWGEPFDMPHSASTTWFLVCVFVATLGKSAQFPFSTWLPRAMEGPTPSSAVFYGALSSHIGAYLLLRYYPMLESELFLRWLIAAVGLLTTGFGALCGRVRVDIKSQLAYAAVAQLGLIYLEIALGWTMLALIHICAHAMLRTLQFLRAPSAISDYLKFRFMHSSKLQKSAQVPSRISMKWQRRLYRLALNEAYMLTFQRCFLVNPMLAIANKFVLLNRWLCQRSGVSHEEFEFLSIRVRSPTVVNDRGRKESSYV